MSVKSELRKLLIALEGVPSKNTIPGLLGEIAIKLGGSGTGKNVAEQIHNIAVAKGYTENPLDELRVDFNIGADVDLFGKVVGDLQTGMDITNGAITGTSKYVKGYTGFSGNVAEQKGNYIALHVSIPGMVIGKDGLTVKVNNSALDSDGLIVLIHKSNNPISVVATKGTASKTISLVTTGITYAADPDAKYTVSYDANGGTGTIDSVQVTPGQSITLDDGSDLTAPEGKEFAGWAKSSSAQSATVTSPFTPTKDETLYAVWVDEEEEQQQG